MNFTTDFSLPFSLGGTVDENISISENAEIVEKVFGNDLECFVDTGDSVPNGKTEKIVSMIADNSCVTASLLFFDPGTGHTFEGIPLGSRMENPEEYFVSSLTDMGINSSNESGVIVLLDHFITIEIGEYICWWDRFFWTRDCFLDEVLDY